jgi:UDP-N-acetyl-D-mannosaminuronic acid transferase (WecB/TagA/CpsF family)
VRDALHFGVRHAFAVCRSHYEVNLVALSDGYLDAPDEVLDATDAEAQAPAVILVAMFEEDIVPPPINL